MYRILSGYENMNPLEYYNRQKVSWEESELQQLRTEYVTNEMTISQMGDIHRRTPGSISYALKRLDIITNNVIARGYSEYKNSDLYKEIVGTPRAKKDPSKPLESSGEKWTEIEEQQLLNELEIKMNMTNISENHKRTESAIRKHIKQMICKMYNSGKTVEQIVSSTNMTQQQIKFIIRNISNDEKEEPSPSLIKVKPVQPLQTEFNILKTEVGQMRTELTEIKTEIKTFGKEFVSLKKSIQQMMIMMKTIYEFETDQ